MKPSRGDKCAIILLIYCKYCMAERERGRMVGGNTRIAFRYYHHQHERWEHFYNLANFIVPQYENRAHTHTLFM